MVLLQEAHEEFGKRAVLGRISARILTQAIYCWQGQFGTAAAEDPWPKGQVDCGPWGRQDLRPRNRRCRRAGRGALRPSSQPSRTSARDLWIPQIPSVTNAIEISGMRKGTGGWVKKATGK